MGRPMEAVVSDMPLPVVDLRDYVLITMPKSTCPDCKQHIYGLSPRSLELTDQPFYFLCLCGRNVQAGCAEVIAPREDRGLSND